jgi:hypothetical protein
MTPSLPRKCLRCGSERIAAIRFPIPAFDRTLQEDLKLRRAVLPGRAPADNDPRWHCLECGLEWGQPRGLSGSSAGAADLG